MMGICSRTAVDSLNTHTLHEIADFQPANLVSFTAQQALQHAASGKRIVEMQLIDPPHQGKIGSRHWARQIIDAASADTERFGLPGGREFVLAVDHLFAPSNPALVSAPSKKSFSSVSSPI